MSKTKETLQYHHFITQTVQDGKTVDLFVMVPVMRSRATELSQWNAIMSAGQTHTFMSVALDDTRLRFQIRKKNLQDNTYPVLTVISAKHGSFRVPFDPNDDGFDEAKRTLRNIKQSFQERYSAKQGKKTGTDNAPVGAGSRKVGTVEKNSNASELSNTATDTKHQSSDSEEGKVSAKHNESGGSDKVVDLTERFRRSHKPDIADEAPEGAFEDGVAALDRDWVADDSPSAQSKQQGRPRSSQKVPEGRSGSPSRPRPSPEHNRAAQPSVKQGLSQQIQVENTPQARGTSVWGRVASGFMWGSGAVVVATTAFLLAGEVYASEPGETEAYEAHGFPVPEQVVDRASAEALSPCGFGVESAMDDQGVEALEGAKSGTESVGSDSQVTESSEFKALSIRSEG